MDFLAVEFWRSGTLAREAGVVCGAAGVADGVGDSCDGGGVVDGAADEEAWRADGECGVVVLDGGLFLRGWWCLVEGR